MSSGTSTGELARPSSAVLLTPNILYCARRRVEGLAPYSAIYHQADGVSIREGVVAPAVWPGLPQHRQGHQRRPVRRGLRAARARRLRYRDRRGPRRLPGRHRSPAGRAGRVMLPRPLLPELHPRGPARHVRATGPPPGPVPGGPARRGQDRRAVPGDGRASARDKDATSRSRPAEAHPFVSAISYPPGEPVNHTSAMSARVSVIRSAARDGRPGPSSRVRPAT
jgi:hypothetical protein